MKLPVFTLSGKKKISALLAALFTAAFTKDAANYNIILLFIFSTVGGYLFAETSVDRQRAAMTFLQTVLYNFKEWKTLPNQLVPEVVAAEKVAGVRLLTGLPSRGADV